MSEQPIPLPAGYEQRICIRCYQPVAALVALPSRTCSLRCADAAAVIVELSAHVERKQVAQ